MNQKYLMILEVSQKQAYIFSSNKLKDNVRNSGIIEYVTSNEYFETFSGYNKSNMVYSGGGHTVLVFESREQAVEFAKKVTKNVKEQFHGIEYFVKVIPLEVAPNEAILELSKQLEKKKSLRKNAFEQVDVGYGFCREPMKLNMQFGDYTSLMPEGYHYINELSDLGGIKGECNFIAVVHIDGNAMGERIQTLAKEKLNGLEWEDYRQELQKFSSGIDKDFKTAFKNMLKIVAKNMENEEIKQHFDIKDKVLPIRPIILAGDDICFIAEGRIGVEASAIFLEELSKIKNEVDNKTYTGCAGICIVHNKYPFYKAYELAEELCSAAKKEMTKQYDTREISAIDWHIEYGELHENIEQMKATYETLDGHHLQLKPYAIYNGEKDKMIEGIRSYKEFCDLMDRLLNSEERIARSKLKELRNIFKQGEEVSKNYIEVNGLSEIFTYRNKKFYEEIYQYNDIKEGMEQYKNNKFKLKDLFYNIADTQQKDKRNIFFDGIEMMDCFIKLGRGDDRDEN